MAARIADERMLVCVRCGFVVAKAASPRRIHPDTIGTAEPMTTSTLSDQPARGRAHEMTGVGATAEVLVYDYDRAAAALGVSTIGSLFQSVRGGT
jgi:hypothetical protein